MHLHVLAPGHAWERRVALTPSGAKRLVSEGHEVSVDPGAGTAAGFPDADYESVGATVGPATKADLTLCVEPPDPDDLQGAGAVLGLLDPLGDAEAIRRLAETGVALLAFELVPRTTRAQAVDVLSSQAALAGYQATLEAATLSNRIFPMMTTAAGTLRPARVLVLGAGVAGLQAIATARRLGAVVSGFDVRAAAAEQVESLGATFVSVEVEPQDAQTSGGYAQELADEAEKRLLEGLFDHVVAADAVITAAAIPGKRAPTLVTSGMVREMRPGAVVIDGSASTGGNCEASVPGQTIEVDHVVVAAPFDLPSRNANHASELFSRNVVNYVGLVTTDTRTLDIGIDDDIVQATLVAVDGVIVNERVASNVTED